MPTLADALRSAASRLAEAGVGEAQADARLLLCAATGIDRVALLRDPDARMDAGAEVRFDDLVARRLAREPVWRILGRRGFWGLDLRVTPDVLDPRPDTETLVEAVLGRLGRDRERPWRILDLGTGSGAILCALLSELPAARGWGIDRSLAACRVARDNLAACGVAARSLVLNGDWSGAAPPHGFDLVVSNPPYIETAVIDGLEAEVRQYDPMAALDGGPDGLAAYRVIAAQLPGLLAPGGAAYLELGRGQAEPVARLLAAAGFRPGETYHDLAGIERVIAADRDTAG